MDIELLVNVFFKKIHSVTSRDHVMCHLSVHFPSLHAGDFSVLDVNLRNTAYVVAGANQSPLELWIKTQACLVPKKVHFINVTKKELPV